MVLRPSFTRRCKTGGVRIDTFRRTFSLRHGERAGFHPRLSAGDRGLASPPLRGIALRRVRVVLQLNRRKPILALTSL